MGVVGGAERVLIECARQTRRLRPEWKLSAILFADGPLNHALADLGVSVEVVALPVKLTATGDSRRFALSSTGPNPFESHSKRGEKKNGWNRFSRSLSAGFSMIGQLPAGIVFLWLLRKSLRRIQPELIHSNGLKSHFCLAATMPRGSRLLWHIHDFYSLRTRLKRALQLASLRASGCFAISRSVERDVRKVLPNLDSHLMLNAVDTVHFCPGPAEPESLDRAAGLPFTDPSLDAEKIRVGIVATYARWKGQDVFLRAISRVPDIRAFIVGGPIYATQGSQWCVAELQELAKSLGVTDRVGFIPFQKDPLWIYRSLDIVVHASTQPEPFGLTIVEAMACGKPVIVSAAGGANELFENGKSGVGFESGNVGELAGLILALTEDRKRRDDLGECARVAATRDFPVTGFGRRLLEIYSLVCPQLEK